MPYIEQRFRDEVDKGLAHITELVAMLTHEVSAGIVAYCIFKLLDALAGKPRRRFWRLALAGGVAIYAVLEFYHRIARPYEDDKWAENGDVL